MELKEGISIFLDTAPIIYFIEEHPSYSGLMDSVISKATNNRIKIVTSIITFIEVMTKPYKLRQMELVKTYQNFFYNSKNFSVVDLNPNIALLTAKIRADFNFKLPDAVQLAIFEYMGLELFLTNDVQLKRYNENKVIILSEVRTVS
jgi:predicted nucleic acid-binding protein